MRKDSPTHPDQILPLLRQTPQRLLELSAGVDEAQLASPPAPGAWSALIILAHLRSCADVWSASIYRMLAEEQPRIHEIHPRQRWKKVDYTQDGYHGGCELFAAQRQALLERLASLPPEAWLRGALIKGREHTVFSHARRMALHEAAHLEQIRVLVQQGFPKSSNPSLTPAMSRSPAPLPRGEGKMPCSRREQDQAK